MDRLACIQTFVRIVEMGNLSTVAKTLGTTQPTVSKQLAALEDDLGVRLLLRSTRSLVLTEEGERFYEHCHDILGAMAAAEASVKGNDEPAGQLRLNCSVAFGQRQIIPLLSKFLSEYPQVDVQLTLDDGFVNLWEQGVDVAIRIGGQRDRRLVERLIGTTRRITVARQTYLDRCGQPEMPQDLTKHECIVYTRLLTGNHWEYQGKGRLISTPVQGRVRVDSSVGVRAATLAGMGVALTPSWLFEPEEYDRDNPLRPLLPDYAPLSMPIHAVYVKQPYVPRRIHCLIDFLARAFQSHPDLAVPG
ncbi:LysR family transcriptional regulator [Gloeomargarita lithophora Alchichica-D10]|uniref:LysR family transcriptional regulator n=1 Tax=Gloeomargarita lithophora Alchichica-D10 TaxID=1188229 RepID=A0A1J0ABT5_9CYAN|nr:LysR family transcriptional regulator [Gloeomargarita lithophora]APB33389.1 LysR family transcriptional regulator [Gloeomargarita lithophora Alchichica-D10]